MSLEYLQGCTTIHNTLSLCAFTIVLLIGIGLTALQIATEKCLTLEYNLHRNNINCIYNRSE